MVKLSQMPVVSGWAVMSCLLHGAGPGSSLAFAMDIDTVENAEMLQHSTIEAAVRVRSVWRFD